MERIFELDVKEKSQVLPNEEAIERKACKDRLEVLFRMKEIKWL